MASASADLISLSDYAYQRTRDRLDGLTDTEYFWEPVPDCWTIRLAGSDTYRADDSDSLGSRRSRGACGTSSNATEESGIRSGSASSDSPQALRGMTRHRQPQSKPSLSWSVPTPSGRACSMSCRQIPGGSRWGQLLARTPKRTERPSCSISLTNRSTTARSSGCCVTSTVIARRRIEHDPVVVNTC